DLPRWEAGRHADDVGALALTGDLVPDRQLTDGPRVDETERVVRVVRAVAEAVHAERAGVLAGGHAHPRRHRDWRDDRLQPSVAAARHQASKVRETLVSEENLGSRAVESDDQDLHVSSDPPSIAAPGGTPRAVRIVGARSVSPAPAERNGRFMK